MPETIPLLTNTCNNQTIAQSASLGKSKDHFQAKGMSMMSRDLSGMMTESKRHVTTVGPFSILAVSYSNCYSEQYGWDKNNTAKGYDMDTCIVLQHYVRLTGN